MNRVLTGTALALTFAAPAALAEGMAALDTNGDGLVSYEEMLAAVPEISEETFAAIDTNADGTVDADEYATAETAGTLPMDSDG